MTFLNYFLKNIYRRVYFSQFIDWTGVLVWNDAVITPSESEFAIGSEATWTQSIFVKLGAAKIFRQSENFWKHSDFSKTWKPDLPTTCAMMPQQCQRCSELEGRSRMVRRTNSFNVRVKIGRWASAPNPRLLSEILWWWWLGLQFTSFWSFGLFSFWHWARGVGWKKVNGSQT